VGLAARPQAGLVLPESFGGVDSGAIYDGGNPVIWWLSIAAVAFVAWQAYRRRSLALGLISIVIAFTWLSWARIDRASFEYHYYATLPSSSWVSPTSSPSSGTGHPRGRGGWRAAPRRWPCCSR